MLPVDYYFCCLNPTERGVLRSTAEALLLTLFLGVPYDLWDAFWFGAPASGEVRRLSFLSIYGLEIVTIDVDLVPTEVVRPQVSYLPYWVEVSVYILTPAAACLSGCEQSRVLPP